MRHLLLAVFAAACAALDIPEFQPPTIKLPPGEQPVALQRLAISAQVRGVLAEVTTTMVLANPNPRQLAGELEFPLPDGAAVCGYALDIGGRMVEGVIVPQDQARVVLETESRRRVDPGLVEQVRGNVFRTRIFPLPANGARTVTVTWTAPLTVRDDEAALRLPLPRTLLPRLELVVEIVAPGVEPQLGGFGDLRLTQWQGGQRATAVLDRVTPGDDLLVRLPRLPAVLVQIEEQRGERFALISAKPGAMLDGAPPPRRLAVAWDASGSLDAAAAQRGRALLSSLFAAVPGLTIDLLAFDVVPHPVANFRDAGALDAHLAALPQDGASGLAGLDLRRAALPHAEDAAWLLISDGLATWGEGIPACGDVRVVCAMPGAQRDEGLLRLVAARTGGAVIDLTTAGDATALVLNPRGVFAGLNAPAGLVGDVVSATRGGRTLVLARLLGEGQVGLRWTGCATVVTQLAGPVQSGSAITRAWAGARAQELAVFPDANRSELLALGRRYGVVTAGTSLLVLETLDQYLRHEIEPPASWPEVREPWLAQFKDRQIQRERRAVGHQERLLRWWDERLRWWHGRDVPPPLAKAQPAEQEAPPMRIQSIPAPAAAPEARGREEAVADSEMGGQGAFMAIGAGGGSAGMYGARKSAAGGERQNAATPATITIAAWNPATPWLAALRAAGPGKSYDAWLAQRPQLANSPSAVLDCAGFILPLDRRLGLRVLSNLAEMRLDDPALLRVLAWRLQDAGELDAAISILRRVLRLRPEEPQAYRDLALALGTRFDRNAAAADADEALALLARVIERRPLEDRQLGARWTVDGNWDRFPRCEIIALEEFNRIAARAEGRGATIPELDRRLRVNLDCDLRVVMAWDADATDIDLHVLQPDGETAFYGRNRTSAGGLVSNDCTQGYGPEEYLIRRAPAGTYAVSCRYFGSRQTGLLGPATVTATVILDWGRPSERAQRLTLRLDRQGDAIPVGSVQVGDGLPLPTAAATCDRNLLKDLKLGMSRAEVEQRLGQPERIDSAGVTVLVYRTSDGAVINAGLGPELLWVREIFNGGERDLLR
jgi:Ca-activated chloride channel family protein